MNRIKQPFISRAGWCFQRFHYFTLRGISNANAKMLSNSISMILPLGFMDIQIHNKTVVNLTVLSMASL